jgi:DNA-binding GntR family transcriptional regulator
VPDPPDAIQSGDLSPGERLPAARELADKFNASRTTVRLALSALRSQGLIGSGQGQGTYVRKARPIRVMAMDQDRRARRAENHAATFNTEIALQGRIGRQDIKSVQSEPATAEVAKWLAVPEGSDVLARRSDQPLPSPRTAGSVETAAARRSPLARVHRGRVSQADEPASKKPSRPPTE